MENFNPLLSHMKSESRPHHTRFNSQLNQANDPYLTKFQTLKMSSFKKKPESLESVIYNKNNFEINSNYNREFTPV